jgi:hypothetical protein
LDLVAKVMKKTMDSTAQEGDKIEFAVLDLAPEEPGKKTRAVRYRPLPRSQMNELMAKATAAEAAEKEKNGE